MNHAISYMEERMQVYRNTIQDHNLVVTDEKIENWRKTMSDPRFLMSFMISSINLFADI